MAHMIVTANKLNRRSAPVSNIVDRSNVTDIVNKGFSFDSIGETFNAAGIWYQDADAHYYWGGGLMADATYTINIPVAVPVNVSTPTNTPWQPLLLRRQHLLIY